jgi:hypothetical protein
LDRKRNAWLEALKKAIPSPELALGKHINCTSDEYRQYAADFIEDSGFEKRMPLDLLAAFASDVRVIRACFSHAVLFYHGIWSSIFP